ncbi:TlpA family protein disulfide reductase [Fulvivirga sp. M361]|uniref:TlpA family protein disulfide reductase n=1 Tax=Fulvivirga sp. M361 TaxID=2594266 RepID=UPI00117A95EA|nr:TlpA disulfide reductase family protein [Fulvivirga sp. M361]TRX48399.1 TlpA family protein disulfide reductase [Fulvivirga sp. M361]
MKYLIVFIAVITFFSCNGSRQSVEETQSVDASELSSMQLLNIDGSLINWQEVKGKAVFLNFWATWCGPCVKEMPYIEAAARALKEENIVFLLATEESTEKIKSFEQKFGYQLDLVRQKTSLASLDITAIPTTYIYNTKGKRVFAETSARKWDTDENIKLLKELMKKP